MQSWRLCNNLQSNIVSIRTQMQHESYQLSVYHISFKSSTFWEIVFDKLEGNNLNLFHFTHCMTEWVWVYFPRCLNVFSVKPPLSFRRTWCKSGPNWWQIWWAVLTWPHPSFCHTISQTSVNVAFHARVRTHNCFIACAHEIVKRE